MRSTSMQAAEVLYPTLSAFHTVQGCALKGIRQVSLEGSLERLIFDFGSVILKVTADGDDDTVDLAAAPADLPMQWLEGQDVSNLQPWTDFVDHLFGWGWLIINQQGYIDGVLIGFDGIDPQLLLNVIASSIKVSRIAKLSL